MKRYIYIIILLLLFITTKDIYAYSSNDYVNKNLCGKYEVVDLKENGSITTYKCFDNFDSAKEYTNKIDTNGISVLSKVNNKTKIVYSKYALCDLSVNYELLTYFYQNYNSKSSYTYMDTGSLYGGVDAAVIDVVLYNGIYFAKVKIGNFTGWIKDYTYEIVPITWVKSSSSYTITNSDIRHNYVSKIQNIYNGSNGSTIGPKPDMLSVGNYYSYDGTYFYKDIKTMLKDYKNNNYNNSINNNNPYYNYYMYLSNHTKTNYSNININDYIRNNLKITKDVYGISSSNNSSRLYGSGDYFIYAQEKYGVNALLSLSLSRNETGNGKSNLAINKNNGFGLNAVDSNPKEAANWYPNFASSILGFASGWMTYGYLHPRDWRYFGPQAGDKLLGINVKYASDTFWSEKLASNYYQFDKAYGMQDYNNYQLGVLKRSYNAYANPSLSSKIIYSYPEKGDAVVIVDEVKGDYVNGSNIWYKLVSDLNIDSNKNEITSGNYNWNAYVYVPSNEIYKINKSKNGYKNPNSTIKYKNTNYEYDFYINNQELNPKVGITLNNIKYYYDSSLLSNTNNELKKDRYVVIYATSYENNKPISHLVTTNYKYNEKHWVSADSIKITDVGLAKVNLYLSSNSYTWVNKTPEDREDTVIGGLYNYTYVPVLEKINKNNEIWYKVPVELSSDNNIYGYTLSSYKTTVKLDLINSIKTNNKPVISAKDIIINQNVEVDLLKDVSATDLEDGNITNKIKVIKNNYTNTNPGVYKITYEVVDSNNNKVTKDINITVLEVKKEEIKEEKQEDIKEEIKEEVKDKDEEKDTKEEVKDEKDIKEDKKEETIDEDDNEEEINDNYEEKDGLFYFDYLKVINNKLQIKGYYALKGIDNSKDEKFIYKLILKNQLTGKEIEYNLDRIFNKEEMTRPVISSDKYDYTYSWFKGYIDIDILDDGDYEAYIYVSNNKYYAKEIINNKLLREQVSSYKSKKYLTTRCNYYRNDLALEFIVRSEKIADKTSDSTYNHYTQYRKLEFNDNKLNIKGVAYSYNMDLSENINVDRKIIFENINNFKKYKYDISSTTDGLYKVGTNLEDNKDKTRAWFDSSFDISNMDKGVYAIYIYTKSNIEDYAELNDILLRDLSNTKKEINNKKYSFRINNNKRYRIELVIE